MHEKSNIIVSSIWYETKVMDRILIPKEEKIKFWLKKKIGNACDASKKKARFTRKKNPTKNSWPKKTKQANDSS